jgi:Zn-dependent protease with chaperone function
LKLGLPLLAALEPQERVALIGHELGHARNGDSSRGLFVGSAIRGLASWYTVLAPHGTTGMAGSVQRDSDLRLAEHVANVFLWVLSRPPLLLFHVEVGLLLHDSRRAEFLADAIGARVSGSDAAIALHEKLLLSSSFEQVVRQCAHPSATDVDVFDAAKSFLDTVPRRERERRRRVAMLEASTLGSTHPPTGQRIRLLEQRPVRSAQVTLTAGESEQIDRELGRLRKPLQRRLIENQRSRLYQR